MAYYDRIAGKWHKATGFRGGAFKEYVLNDAIISRLPDIDEKSVLEIGIGNGYFMPLVLKKKSGQIPKALYLTDISTKNLEIAQRYFCIPFANYQRLDIYKPFPFEDESVDLIISNMVLNEVHPDGLNNGLSEIKRILRPEGMFILSVLHPHFIEKQIARGVIQANLMPSKNGIKVPAIRRSLEEYKKALSELSLQYEMEDLYGNAKLLSAKPALKAIKDIPIGLIIHGVKSN